jgi:hypothetical protein
LEEGCQEPEDGYLGDTEVVCSEPHTNYLADPEQEFPELQWRAALPDHHQETVAVLDGLKEVSSPLHYLNFC